LAPSVSGKFEDALKAFADRLTKNFAAKVPANPEDQLKGPLQDLLEQAGKTIGTASVVARTEAQVGGLGGRPDLGVARGNLLVGHVELKAPGKRGIPELLKGADKEQWQKFQALPNLIYTNGSEWTLYRTGAREGTIIRFSGDVTTDGATAFTTKEAEKLLDLLRDFLLWDPIPPARPRELAKLLAPLCRLLRHDVLEVVADSTSDLNKLAAEWRELLFPDADDAQFADAYAQTVTYALLLARLSGATDVSRDSAAKILSKNHGLLARSLQVLEDDEVRDEIGLALDLLERVISAVDPIALTRKGRDPWLYFYEDFLAEYDPKLRKARGVYYTPVEVVGAQVRLVAELLQKKFGKQLAFADDGVTLLDPAAGTGTYPLAAIQHGLGLVEKSYGAGAIAARASELAKNVHAFEILVGPYAVAHLRFTKEIHDAGGVLPSDGVHVYLTDTLDSPHAIPSGKFPMFAKPLATEHKRALEVKASIPILACIGNPPYDRQQIDPADTAFEKRKGGWVRSGEGGKGEVGILEDFLKPAREAGAGGHLKNLYNDYVYFWRWALWKVFESGSRNGGVVSFITASSYIRGPGFIGMRKVMREIFDDLWIIDLEGDNLGARKTENVFDIQTPVAIAVGVRSGSGDSSTPASVHYARFVGTRKEKFAQLDAVGAFSDVDWLDCLEGWMDPFLPKSAEEYSAWPLLTAIFPWQHSGVQMKRAWPISETKELLESRWRELMRSSDRAAAFKETRDRKISKSYPDLDHRKVKLDKLEDLGSTAIGRDIVHYGYRSFDRRWLLKDNRLGDFMRPPLWSSHGPKQVFMTSLLTNVLGLGPAATVCANPPDLHHFRGSFGGNDAIPLWRDTAASEPNVTDGLLKLLEAEYGHPVSAEELFAYCYALLASPEYVHRFWGELVVPGPRIPLTKDVNLFSQAVDLGTELIWLHTYGERFVPTGKKPGDPPKGSARNTVPIPQAPQDYPDDFGYDVATETLRVGSGEFKPVSQEVWSFSVSGYEVVRAWLAARIRGGSGKKSSVLDELRPERWTATMTEELIKLLWILEATIGLFPKLASTLDDVVGSDLFTGNELPSPGESERKPPTHEEEASDPALF
jgi:hypothetical protein